MLTTSTSGFPSFVQVFINLLNAELSKVESFHLQMRAELTAHYPALMTAAALKTAPHDEDLAEMLRDVHHWGDYCALNSTACLKILKKRTRPSFRFKKKKMVDPALSPVGHTAFQLVI